MINDRFALADGLNSRQNLLMQHQKRLADTSWHCFIKQ
jgi:hypothetical protein